MKLNGIGVALFLATCLVGPGLTRGQSQTQQEDVSSLRVTEEIQKLSSSDPIKRAAAACALGKIGKAAVPAIPALIGLLGDGRRIDPKLVCYREYFAEAKVEPEFEGLKEPSPAEAAMQTLIALGRPSVEPLIAALKNDQWRVRKNAAWALAQIKDRRSLLPLIAALEDDAWQVRAYSAAALGQHRDARVTEPLIIALYDKTAAVRWFAASSLGQTKDRRAVGPLIVALKDKHPRTRAFAAASLGQIRDSRTVPPLIDATIVGVVANHIQPGVDNRIWEEMFYPYVNTADPPLSQMNLVVKTAADPSAMSSAIINEARRPDRLVTITGIRTMDDLRAGALQSDRFNLWLLGSFALIALLLAVLGIYGVMTYTTAQRTHEIGIRMALGAQTPDVLRLVVKNGMRLTLIGVAIGLAGAFALTRMMASLLFEVTPTDAMTYGVVSVGLLLVALLACYIPARRATKVDPLVALRYE